MHKRTLLKYLHARGLWLEFPKVSVKQPQASGLAMEDTQDWYIVKEKDGHCEIVSHETLEKKQAPESQDRWGPFSSQEEAVARRVGLIRAGKCQPV